MCLQSPHGFSKAERNTMEQTAFQIDLRDNVATALTELHPGTVRLLGDASQDSIAAVEEIPKGHKIALTEILPGDSVVKYGVVIGSATARILPGTWVHLHVMRSNVDERSSHLDTITGAPMDTRYE